MPSLPCKKTFYDIRIIKMQKFSVANHGAGILPDGERKLVGK